MKNSSIAFILILMALFFGCKTTKTTFEQKTQTTTKYDLEEYFHQKEIQHEQESREEVHEQFTTVFSEYVREYFSAPDSTGKQYVLERITANTKSDIIAKATGKSNRETDIEKSAEQSKHDKTTTESNTQTKATAQTKVKSPFAINWLVIALSLLLCAVLAAVVVLFIRKLKHK